MKERSKILNWNNIRRTVSYIRKNGAADGLYAALERIGEKRRDSYVYKPLSKEEAKQQKEEAEGLGKAVCFSILVPAFETKELYMRQLIESVLAQTWENWELVIADASASDRVEKTVREYQDARIRYVRLSKNRGISGNSNEALKAVTGSYTGLLDHDDLLTQDALFEMARALFQERQAGREPVFLYSDEDKTDPEGRRFYEPHFKTDFNPDLLLSNNYICHFLVARTGLLKETGFRALYDGAQDYDLILRLLKGAEPSAVVHLSKVLYHWRCHEQSTAENPASKQYAYEAGRRAVSDYCEGRGWDVEIRHEKHLGFYRVEYRGELFRIREDIGAVGGRLLRRGKVAGGAYRADGTLLYGGLCRRFSGYMHRAVLMQDVAALDIRFCRIRREAAELLQEAFLRETGKQLSRESLAFLQTDFYADLQSSLAVRQQKEFIRQLAAEGFTEEMLCRGSLRFGEALRERGYQLLYDPGREWKL